MACHNDSERIAHIFLPTSSSLPVHDNWCHSHVVLNHDLVYSFQGNHFGFHDGISDGIKICKSQAKNHEKEPSHRLTWNSTSPHHSRGVKDLPMLGKKESLERCLIMACICLCCCCSCLSWSRRSCSKSGCSSSRSGRCWLF